MWQGPKHCEITKPLFVNHLLTNHAHYGVIAVVLTADVPALMTA